MIKVLIIHFPSFGLKIREAKKTEKYMNLDGVDATRLFFCSIGRYNGLSKGADATMLLQHS